MKRLRYPAELKAEAVLQVTDRGHGVVDVAKRLGMSDKSLYLWVGLAKNNANTWGGRNCPAQSRSVTPEGGLKEGQPRA
jgi:transposase-like protein